MTECSKMKCTKCKRTQDHTEYFGLKGKTCKVCATCRARNAERQQNNPVVKPLANYNGKEIPLQERVDKTKLNYILAHRDEYDLGSTRLADGSRTEGDAQLTILYEYHNSLNSNGAQEVLYKQKKGMGDNLPHGRMTACRKISLQNLCKRIRHTICSETMYDIDIKNAHPVLLAWYCNQKNIECDWLEKYITDREELIAEFMTKRACLRDEAKATILAVLNGKYISPENLPIYPEWFQNYYKQIQGVINEVCKLNPEEFNNAKLSKGAKGITYNIKGSCMSRVMSEMENRALMVAYDVMRKHHIEVSSLVYDGLMIYKKDCDETRIPQLLEILTKSCKSILDIDLEWDIKEMTEGYDIDVEDYRPSPLEDLRQEAHPSAITLFGETADNDYIRRTIIPESVPYVEDIVFPEGYRCVAIRAMLGKGKTTSICRYIEENKLERVLVVSPRVSFASSITNEYNQKIPSGERFVCYTDVARESLIARNRVVCSMESLHYFANRPTWWQQFDLLIVDESQANLKSHCSKATNEKWIDTNEYVFTYFLHCSKKVIFADAFLGKLTAQFITHQQLPCFLYDYQTPMTKRTAKVICDNDEKDALLPDMVEACEAGKRFFVYCSAKSTAERLEAILKAKFENLKIKSYTSGEGRHIKNVNSEWIQYDIIIYTSTITVGINFDIPDHFHCGFLCISAAAKNYITDIFQAHFRVRHLIDNHINLHVYTKMADTGLPCYESQVSGLLTWWEDLVLTKSTRYVRSSKSMKSIIDNIDLEYNLSQAKLTQLVHYFLELCNYTITMDYVKKKDITIEVPHLDDQSGFHDIILVDSKQYRLLRKRQNMGAVLTKDELLQIEKYQFVRTFTCGNPELWVNNSFDDVFWQAYCNYKKTKINNIKTERAIREGVKELYSIETDSYTAIHQDRTQIQTESVMEICNELNIEYSQKKGQTVDKTMLDTWVEKNKDNGIHLRKLFQIRDYRKVKTEQLSYDDSVSLLNSIFKKFGFTKLVRKTKSKNLSKQQRKDNNKLEYELQDDTDTESLGDRIYNSFNLKN